WDGRTLEWAIPSPPPVYNFAEVPVVQSRDDYWEQKYGKRQPARVTGGSGADARDIHLPPPSIVPFVAAVGLAVVGAAMTFHQWVLTGVGLAILLVAIIAWSIEPNE
ncbi:MAG: cytochrome ubiquinol oxidase subunit I, partial [Sphaerobacter sp.]|nr:cytochrome ubiquinol oxidase subunit I [Sphaerobacter sp.]